MARPSPPSRRSYVKSSPERGFLSNFLSDERNSELSHKDALAAAQEHHDRVRETAIRVFELHELQEQHRRLMLEQQKEQERIRIERELVAEEMRLRELKAKEVPKPPPEPEPSKLPPAAKPLQAQLVNGSGPQPVAPANKVEAPASLVASQTSAQRPTQSGVFPALTKTSPPSIRPAAPNGQIPPPSTFVKQQGPTPQTAIPSQQTPNPLAAQAQQIPTQKADPKSAVVSSSDRYVQIHQQLKVLRKEMVEEAKTGPLKGKLGEMRREIRKSIGQLTDVKGANIQPVNKIINTLKAALDMSTLPSTPVDVDLFIVERLDPVEGSALNSPQLPSLFIYLLNMLSKAIISQFINECSAKTEAADPIGVVTAQIFSQRDFQWRGKSMIDILMAKFRVVCPVLFGFRANDKTQSGRLTLGWRPGVDERTHLARMIGLGAGYASIALRDFSKASRTNPFPPSHYWTAMAFIINTPPQQVSDTQYTVLKAMIDGHEPRFIAFYGNAAIAALRLAVVEFPKKAPTKTPPVAALAVLGDLMKKERGLNLS